MLIQLFGLALLDSVGIGTLALPLWMMMRPPFRIGTVLVHLAVVGLLYFGVGIVLLTVVGAVAVAVPGDAWVRLAVGVVALLLGLVCDRRRRRPSRTWWTRPPESVRGVVVLATAVGVVEVATMLPYFAAIDAVAESDRGWAVSVSLLASYVLVTLLPALVLLAAGVAASQTVSLLLARLMRHVEAWSQDAVGTVLLVVGALLAADAAIESNLV